MVRKIALFISIIFIIASLHTLFHVIVYSAGISDIVKTGISGFSIGKVSFESLVPEYQKISQKSMIILVIEWGILLALMISAIIKHKQSLNEKFKTKGILEKYKTKTKTDLDVLYEVLKNKKHLRVSTIMKIFNVSEEIAMNWAKTLESASLASLHYPRIGEPELTINE